MAGLSSMISKSAGQLFSRVGSSIGTGVARGPDVVAQQSSVRQFTGPAAMWQRKNGGVYKCKQIQEAASASSSGSVLPELRVVVGGGGHAGSAPTLAS